MILCVSLEVIHLDECLYLILDEHRLGQEHQSDTFDHLGYELIVKEALASLHDLHRCSLDFEATLAHGSFNDCFALSCGRFGDLVS